MSEAEIYSSFYEGMISEGKDIVNSARGGDFSRLRVSEAKRIIRRLVDAKKAYDDPRTNLLRRGSASSVVVQSDDKIDARIDKLEKAILSAIEKNKQPAPPEKVSAVTGPEEQCQYYGPQGDAEYTAQVNAAGSWNPNGSWNPGKQRDAPWRDHPNFRWGKGNQNQPNPPHNTYNGPSAHDVNPNWSGRNQQNQHQPNSNQNSAYVPPHQRGYQNHQNHQPPQYQNHLGPNHNQHHNSNQPNNYFSNQNQQGSQPQFPKNYQPHPSSHYNSYNQLNPNQPSNFQNQTKPVKSMEELMGELLSAQQHLQNNVQSNNDVVIACKMPRRSIGQVWTCWLNRCPS